jgi:hypothetical protein
MEWNDLQPHESVLTGNWLLEGTTVVGDATCQRIEWLLNSRLERVSTTGWETLYRDPRDGRFWEHTYPHSEMQGGGPTQLKLVATEVAASKYHVGAA